MVEKKTLLHHNSVLLTEVLEYIDLKSGGNYLDCTFGAGGYSHAILQKENCFVTALDQDSTVEPFVQNLKQEFSNRFNFIKTNFANAEDELEAKKFDGIVLDLGVSSMQLDTASRGFSFMQDGPLDMRMGNDGINAKDFVSYASEEEIANVIYKYGEEVQSRQIAKNIVKEREKETIETTLQLAKIIKEAMHYRKGKIDPVTKSFQAIRIYINKELESIERFLAGVENLLNSGGKLLIVSFHSLEDSIVKNFFRDNAVKKVSRSKYSNKPIEIEEGKWLKVITKKPIVPTKLEIQVNPRSRSAKLRVAKKIEVANVV